MIVNSFIVQCNGVDSARYTERRKEGENRARGGGVVGWWWGGEGAQ